MRNIWSIVLASSLFTGCIASNDPDDPPGGGFCGDGIVQGGEQCDDGDNASGDGCSATCAIEGGDDAQITASWSFRDAVGDDPANDVVLGCPAGFPTIAHYNQELDGNGTAVGQPVIDLYDCIDNTNFTDPLTPGVYQTWIESTNDAGTAVYAQSLSAVVDVTVQDATADFAIFDNAGYFFFGWTLRGATTQQPITCAQAGADGVEIISTVTGSMEAVTDQFDCEDGAAVTSRLLAGSYQVSIDAFQDGAGALGEPQNLANQVVGDRNQATDLGSFVLPIDGK